MVDDSHVAFRPRPECKLNGSSQSSTRRAFDVAWRLREGGNTETFVFVPDFWDWVPRGCMIRFIQLCYPMLTLES